MKSVCVIKGIDEFPGDDTGYNIDYIVAVVLCPLPAMAFQVAPAFLIEATMLERHIRHVKRFQPGQAVLHRAFQQSGLNRASFKAELQQ